ncbi:MAG TPA: phosphatidate cytidylyltransferase [Polyangiaceae bacterium]|nr:phosphatidate cytidylyltransferase [Polyangiaceae bacterium]
MTARVSNLVQRFATAAVGIPLILVLLYLAPPWAFYALVLPAALVGSYELFAMTHRNDRVARAIGVLVALAASLTVFAQPANPRALMAVLTLVPLSGPLVTLLRIAPLETAALRACSLGFGPLFVAVPLTLLAVLRRTFDAGHVGAGAALLAIGLAWFPDTGAYFAGRFFGRHKLYEAVSPKKTVEGAVGGLVAAVVWAAGASLSYLRGVLPLGHAIGLGLVAGVFGPAGDLGESLLKRSTGVKDSGAIVPGHGGVLDRVDAVIATSVVVYLYAQWAWTP